MEELIYQKRKIVHTGITAKYAANIKEMKNFQGKVMQLTSAKPVPV